MHTPHSDLDFNWKKYERRQSRQTSAHIAGGSWGMRDDGKRICNCVLPVYFPM